MRASLLILAGLLAILPLSACAPRGVSVPLGYDSLVQCEPRDIEAERMPEIGEPGCNLEGSSVIMPDGTQIILGQVGGVGSQQWFGSDGTGGTEYMSVNWGIPGAAVSKIGPTGAQSWATSDEALDLQAQQLRL